MTSEPQPDQPGEADTGLRACPSVPGDDRPLIVHSVDSGMCAVRQQSGFHRCHRCVYRGKPRDWVYAAPQPFDSATPVVAAAPRQD